MIYNSNVSYAVKVVLKDKYFVNTEKNISNATLLTIMVSVLSLSITIVVWFAQKKRDNSTKYMGKININITRNESLSSTRKKLENNNSLFSI